MCRKRRAQLFSALFLATTMPRSKWRWEEGSADRDDSASRADVAQVGSGLLEG